MKISIIIPCHNAEDYLAQTLRSALSQSRPPDEVIVVDDGSSDGSINVARSFGEDVRLVERRNGSAAVTRKQGYALASGDAVMFLDADDILGPNALESIAEMPELAKRGVVCCPWYRLELHDGRWIQRPPSCAKRRRGEDLLKAWLRGWYHPTSTVLWSREGFERTGGWNPEAGVNDDGDLMMRALALGIPFGIATRGSVYYRRLPDCSFSLSGKRFTHAGLISRLFVVANLVALLERQGRLGQYRSALGSSARGILRDCGSEYPDLVKEIRDLCFRIGDSEWRYKVRTATGRLRRCVRKMRPSRGVPGEPGPPTEIRFGIEVDR